VRWRFSGDRAVLAIRAGRSRFTLQTLPEVTTILPAGRMVVTSGSVCRVKRERPARIASTARSPEKRQRTTDPFGLVRLGGVWKGSAFGETQTAQLSRAPFP